MISSNSLTNTLQFCIQVSLQDFVLIHNVDRGLHSFTKDEKRECARLVAGIKTASSHALSPKYFVLQ